MFDFLQGSGLFVHLAGLAFVAAFLVRDPLVLRGLVALGALLYAVYYWIQPAMPEWGAIALSLLLVGVNLYVLWRLVEERTPFRLTADERRLFTAFQTLTPGDFRRVMKVAEWHRAERPVVLTTEDVALDRLYYVLEGEVTIRKGDRVFTAAPNTFIGEIAFLLGGSATATVEVPAGARYVTWRQAELKRLLGRSPKLKLAIDSLFNQDLAGKLARS